MVFCTCALSNGLMTSLMLERSSTSLRLPSVFQPREQFLNQKCLALRKFTNRRKVCEEQVIFKATIGILYHTSIPDATK